MRKQNSAINKAICALLYQKIIELYNRFIALQYIPIEQRESLYELVKNYKILESEGGEVVDDLMDILNKLPTGPDNIKHGDE